MYSQGTQFRGSHIQSFRSLLLIGCAAVYAASASADGLFKELPRFRQAANFSKRVGVEIELTGLTQGRVAAILQETLGGQIEEEKIPYNYKDYQGLPRVYIKTDLVIKKARIPLLRIKLEDNCRTDEELSDIVCPPKVIEVVTSPLTWPQVYVLQRALDRLKLNGASGTTAEQAVSLQVNVEMGTGQIDKIDTEKVLKILRNYLQEENHREIEQRLQVPDIRKAYVGRPTPGFLKRLFSADYHPTRHQLYMDSMYRSCLEQLGDPKAWQYTDQEASAQLSARVKEKNFEILLPVIKWNFVRYSSLMMFLFPDEWLSRYLFATDWFKPYPILEFREPNNDFKAVDTVEWILEFVAASESEGAFTGSSLHSSTACEAELTH